MPVFLNKFALFCDPNKFEYLTYKEIFTTIYKLLSVMSGFIFILSAIFYTNVQTDPMRVINNIPLHNICYLSLNSVIFKTYVFNIHTYVQKKYIFSKNCPSLKIILIIVKIFIVKNDFLYIKN